MTLDLAARVTALEQLVRQQAGRATTAPRTITLARAVAQSSSSTFDAALACPVTLWSFLPLDETTADLESAVDPVLTPVMRGVTLEGVLVAAGASLTAGSIWSLAQLRSGRWIALAQYCGGGYLPTWTACDVDCLDAGLEPDTDTATNCCEEVPAALWFRLPTIDCVYESPAPWSDTFRLTAGGLYRLELTTDCTWESATWAVDGETYFWRLYRAVTAATVYEPESVCWYVSLFRDDTPSDEAVYTWYLCSPQGFCCLCTNSFEFLCNARQGCSGLPRLLCVYPALDSPGSGCDYCAEGDPLWPSVLALHYSTDSGSTWTKGRLIWSEGIGYLNVDSLGTSTCAMFPSTPHPFTCSALSGMQYLSGAVWIQADSGGTCDPVLFNFHCGGPYRLRVTDWDVTL